MSKITKQQDLTPLQAFEILFEVLRGERDGGGLDNEKFMLLAEKVYVLGLVRLLTPHERENMIKAQPQVRQQPPAVPVGGYVAPPTRSVPSLLTGRPQAALPPLSQGEADIAVLSKPRPDMSNEEAIRLYQQNKAHLTRDARMGKDWRGS